MNERRLETTIQSQTETLQLKYKILENKHNSWLMELEKSRQECHLLKLFTNRQIMVMIILLTKSTSNNKIKRYVLEQICSSATMNYSEENEMKLAVHGLTHYLRSLRLNTCNISNVNLSRLCMAYKIESVDNDSMFLEKLSQFLRELLGDGKDLFQNVAVSNENQQYLVTLNPSCEATNQTAIGGDLDMNTCCILLNIFNNHLPSFYQILWCSTATEDDIQLFFSRVRTFHNLIFVVMEIDNMHHRLREQLLNEQNLLTQQEELHGSVYYFSRETTAHQKDLRPFPVPRKYQDPNSTYNQLIELIQRNKCAQPNLEIIYGKAGVGK